ncbi:MAG TPA: hypothetical protein VG916_02155 [Gemmatimonadaceae bacterium]|nr:hypothetical protein [Gemmatimonadaceae bacterium]
MQSSLFYLSESGRRALQFLATNTDAVPSVNETDARRQLETALAEMDAAAAAQDAAVREIRGETGRRTQLERTLVRKYLTPLAEFARASLRGVPEYAALTPAVASLRGPRLVVAANAMATAADKYAGALDQARFPQNFLASLRTAADAVNQSLGIMRGLVQQRVDATSGLVATAGDVRRAKRGLDSLVRHHILGNEVLERGWRLAKRIRQSGSSTAATETPPAQEVKAAA